MGNVELFRPFHPLSLLPLNPNPLTGRQRCINCGRGFEPNEGYIRHGDRVWCLLTLCIAAGHREASRVFAEFQGWRGAL